MDREVRNESPEDATIVGFARTFPHILVRVHTYTRTYVHVHVHARIHQSIIAGGCRRSAERGGKTFSNHSSLHIGRPKGSLFPKFFRISLPVPLCPSRQQWRERALTLQFGEDFLPYVPASTRHFLRAGPSAKRMVLHFSLSLSQPPLSFPLIAQAHVVAAFQSARIVRVLASVAAVIAYMLTHNLMRYRLTARPLAARVCYNRNV